MLGRGQSLRAGERLIFLGTPWFIDPAELAPAGLSLDDFAPHDSLIDYLTLLQTKNTALRDANNLSKHLRETRQQLQRNCKRKSKLSSVAENARSQKNEIDAKKATAARIVANCR